MTPWNYNWFVRVIIFEYAIASNWWDDGIPLYASAYKLQPVSTRRDWTLMIAAGGNPYPHPSDNPSK